MSPESNATSQPLSPQGRGVSGNSLFTWVCLLEALIALSAFGWMHPESKDVN
jgi:hypothetical protein